MSPKINLTIYQHSGKVISEDRWIPCPVCKKPKFFHLHPDTTGWNIPVYCKKCRKEYLVNIVKLPEP